MSVPSVDAPKNIWSLTPTELEGPGQMSLQLILAEGITSEELRESDAGLTAAYRATGTRPGQLPDNPDDRHTVEQAFHLNEAVRNHYIAQQLRLGLKDQGNTLLHTTMASHLASQGLRNALGALDKAELHALATRLGESGGGYASRRGLAELLMLYPGIRLERSTARMLRDSLASDQRALFESRYATHFMPRG